MLSTGVVEVLGEVVIGDPFGPGLASATRPESGMMLE
jgi:hypothetical protein